VEVHWPEGEMKIDDLRFAGPPPPCGRISFHDLSSRVEIQDYRPESDPPIDLPGSRPASRPRLRLALSKGNLVYRRLIASLRVTAMAQVSWGQGYWELSTLSSNPS
jgi:hypothetical protein